MLGKGIKTIRTGMFKNLPIEEIEIPDSVTTIEKEAFSGCNKLTSIVIPDSVTTIQVGTYDSDNPFHGCYSLKEIVLGKGIKTIRKGMLKNLSIEEIVIPDSVTSIQSGDSYDGRPFYGCYSLKKIVLKGTDTTQLKKTKDRLIKIDSSFEGIIQFQN